MTELYPKLKHYCRHHNCELQIIDMHWAMDASAFDNHSYAENCIKAVEDCTRTEAINFIVST